MQFIATGHGNVDGMQGTSILLPECLIRPWQFKCQELGVTSSVSYTMFCHRQYYLEVGSRGSGSPGSGSQGLCSIQTHNPGRRCYP